MTKYEAVEVIIRIEDSYIYAKVDFDYTPEVPGNYRGHPDTWTPSEPEEIEITGISYKDFNINWMLEDDEIAESIKSQCCDYALENPAG